MTVSSSISRFLREPLMIWTRRPALPQLSAESLTAGKGLTLLQHQVSVMILRLFIQPSSMDRVEKGRWWGFLSLPRTERLWQSVWMFSNKTTKKKKKQELLTASSGPAIFSNCYTLPRAVNFSAILIFYQQRKHFHPLVNLLHPEPLFSTFDLMILTCFLFQNGLTNLPSYPPPLNLLAASDFSVKRAR